jgi:hypothetical protein
MPHLSWLQLQIPLSHSLTLPPMSNRTLTLNDALYDYLLSTSVQEPEILTALRRETAEHPMAQMQIAPEQPNPSWLPPIQQGKQPFAPTVWPFGNRGYVTRI